MSTGDPEELPPGRGYQPEPYARLRLMWNELRLASLPYLKDLTTTAERLTAEGHYQAAILIALPSTFAELPDRRRMQPR